MSPIVRNLLAAGLLLPLAVRAERIRAAESSATDKPNIIAKRVIRGHGYEKYPTLFSRTIPWEQKAPLLKTGRGDRKP